MIGREKEDLLGKALRGALSSAEEQKWHALLRIDPGLRERFAEEQAIDRALAALPDAPISTNFTSLVLRAAEREQRSHDREPVTWRFRWPLVRRLVGAAAVLLLTVTGLQTYRNHQASREEMAMNVQSFSAFAAAVSSSKTPAEEVFEDFEAIQRLPLAADADIDLELLVALEK